MGFRSRCSIAIIICLTSIVVGNFGELLVLRHSGSTRYHPKNLTCLSEDDESALIWNRDPDPYIGSPAAFQPKTRSSNDASECAISNSTQCLAKWGEKSRWNIVNSSLSPMGPVFDFRWEDFREYRSHLELRYQAYTKVHQLSESSASVVFSAKGPKDLHIFLCEEEDPKKGPCLWTILGGWEGNKSATRRCPDGAPPDGIGPMIGTCLVLGESQHGVGNSIHKDEWRTFILKWDNHENTLEVFKDVSSHENEPFLRYQFAPYFSPRVSHLSIRHDRFTSVRFHFYEYYLSESNEAVISTEEFDHKGENFCVELLVGLCHECRIEVDLVDEDGAHNNIGTIRGEARNANTNLLTWRWEKLSKKLDNPNFKNVRLEIKTNIRGGQGQGQWAIDRFRICKPAGQIRKSTITIYNWLQYQATCQKLSYSKSAVVYSTSKNPIYSLNNRSEDLLNQCGSSCSHLGESWSICSPIGCTCARGFGGNDCGEECTHGYYGYNCSATCSPACEKGFCDKITGHCGTEIPPPVKDLEAYEADIASETISLRWIPPNPANGRIESYTVVVKNAGQILSAKSNVSTERVKCELWEEYECIADVRVPYIIPGGTKIEVTARNKGALENGAAQITAISPDIYSRRPGEPKILTSTPQGHGIVTLNWAPPAFTPTRISRYVIHVRLLNTRLQLPRINEFAIRLEHKVTGKQKEYTHELHLLTSTVYSVSVVAVNKLDVTSTRSETEITIPGGVTFVRGEELQVIKNGTLIELKPPKVVNATLNTSVSIVVNEIATYEKKDSEALASFTKIKEWIAAEYRVNESESQSPTIDCMQNPDVELHCSLHDGRTYIFTAIVKDLSSNQSVTLMSSPITLIEDGQDLTWLIIFPVIAICMMIVLVGYRIRKRVSKQPREPSYLEILPPLPETARRGSPTLLNSPNISVSFPGAAENRSSAPLYCVPNQPDSRTVSAEYFEEYAKEATASGILYSQFALLPTGLTRSCEYGRLPENMAKNRYRNLIAYDETRVVLKRIPGDSHSDYINASYMKGYNKEKAYIAAQGPQPNTVNDFWRMIWQEEVRVICMLVNVIEGEKKMCEQYWPDVGTRVKYGDFLISNADHQVFADYTFRTFKLSYKQETRKVMHLHYTGWPSLGVPIYPQSLVAFLKKLGHTPAGNGPVVVHCNTGDNRTGTIILCDICIRQALSERMIDATAETRRMRDSRTNMVGTLQHYILAHIVIGESLVLLPTQVPCTDDLPDDIERMKQKLPFDMQRLNDTMWQEEALRSLDGPGPSTVEDVANDDLPELLADGSEMVYADVVGIEKNRINAVSVDGIKMKKQYQASCLPSPFTLPDFWRFVAESQIKLIIILQCSDPTDPICCDILPDESTVDGLPEIRVKNKTSLVEGDYLTNEELLLTETSQENGKPQSVTVLTCKGWGRENNAKPPKPVTLVSLWRASETIPREGGQTWVLCHDGITGCGLYLALSFLLERMAVERECDVISAVRAVRRSRPEFVQSMDQFQYLYDAAVSYVNCFQTYANFS